MKKIVSWNVNSVKARLERLLAYLARETPDIVCLQELKCVEEAFPFSEIEKCGYHAAVYGQKTYNGVALLSRLPFNKVQKGFNDGNPDSAARYISANIDGIRVASAYIPNGQMVGSEKYQYKLEWFQRLQKHLRETTSSSPNDPLVIGGDFNVAPEDRDVHDPALWEGKILFSAPERQALQALFDMGLKDTFRLHHQENQHFSWWDYRMLSFPKNLGLRIDFILANNAMAQRCTSAFIDRNERKGTSPSDHAPVGAIFEW